MSNDLNQEKTPKETVDAVGTSKALENLKETTPINSNKSTQVSTANLPTDYTAVAQAANNLGSMLALAEVYVKGKMCPLKTAEDVVIAITTGQQLGLPFMTSINYIFPINGKPAMSTHLHRAILLRHGVTFKKLDDNEPVYNYYEDDGTGTGVAKKVKTKNAAGQEIEVPILIGDFTARTAPKNSVRGRKIVDRITTYSFEREIKTQSGKYKTITAESSFTMREAETAELMVNPPWIKYPARMLDARAFGIGSKEIGADLLLGVPSISEMAEVYDMQYEVNDSYEEAVVVN